MSVMTVVTAEVGFNEPTETRTGLEYIIMCTDSQRTRQARVILKSSKWLVQKIHPIGNAIISGSGSGELIDSAVAGAFKFMQKHPDLPIQGLTGHMLAHVSSQVRKDTLTGSKENSLVTELVIAGPINGGRPLHLGLMPLAWHYLKSGYAPGLASVKAYSGGSGGIIPRVKKSLPAKLLNEHGINKNNIVSSLLRVYLRAYIGSSNLYVDRDFQLAVQLISSWRFDMHTIFPPEVPITGNHSLNFGSEAERRVRLFVGCGLSRELDGMAEKDFVEEARWLGEYHRVYSTLLKRAANCVISRKEEKNWHVTNESRREFSVAVEDLTLSVSAFLSGSLSEARAAVKAYHNSFS